MDENRYNETEGTSPVTFLRSVLDFHQDISPVSGRTGSHEEVEEGPHEFMVGDCAAMRKIFHAIRRMAQSDAPVLVTGETGTGKELAAQAIHQRSSRAKGPFVAINCAALPASLIASELFGYEKGAFTGAVGRKFGLIEQAHGGSLFLDEVGDLPYELQGHLLRFLQEGTIIRVGGNTQIRVDARIISATHVHLEAGIEAGKFRGDLFYRLNVLPLYMPALRERDGDLELLAEFFLRKIAGEFGREIKGFSPEALERIRSYSWPGNIREMISAIRRAVVMGDDQFVRHTDLGLRSEKSELNAVRSVKRIPETACSSRKTCSSDELIEALKRHSYNITNVAGELSLSRVTIYRMMKRYGLERQLNS